MTCSKSLQSILVTFLFSHAPFRSMKKKISDYFKCIYFLLSRAPLGKSHYLAPVALGFLIMRKIFLVGNLFLLTCPSQCWSEHTAFYSMCGTVLPSANGVHQAWWSQWLIQPPPPTSTYILVHWVGYKPTTLRIGTSSLTTRAVEMQAKWKMLFICSQLGRMGLTWSKTRHCLYREIIFRLPRQPDRAPLNFPFLMWNSRN